jgi:hypothetical protein
MLEPKQPYVIRYWFEWCSTCFWGADNQTKERFGYPIEPEDLPLSSATIKLAHELMQWHDQALNWVYPPDPGPWRQDECDRFNQAARELLATCRQELGEDFNLIDQFQEEKEYPDLDDYLRDPQAFKRKT